jgi:hypothetical protein
MDYIQKLEKQIIQNIDEMDFLKKELTLAKLKFQQQCDHDFKHELYDDYHSIKYLKVCTICELTK